MKLDDLIGISFHFFYLFTINLITLGIDLKGLNFRNTKIWRGHLIDRYNRYRYFRFNCIAIQRAREILDRWNVLDHLTLQDTFLSVIADFLLNCFLDFHY